MASASRKRTGSRKTGRLKKEQMEEMEKAEAFRTEVVLWTIVAVALLLFISNLGFGGIVGKTVSGFLFGVFGLIAYLLPILLLIGSFFAVSNRGNLLASVKLVASVLFVFFLCMFMALVVSGNEAVSPADAYTYSSEHKNGGGIIGGAIAYVLVQAFGMIGAYIIDIIVLIICVVLITERSAIRGMKRGGQKVYASAKENNERYREYREQKNQERSERRMDRKVSGVSADTRIERKKKNPKVSEDMAELRGGEPEPEAELPAVKHNVRGKSAAEKKMETEPERAKQPEEAYPPMPKLTIAGDYMREPTEVASVPLTAVGVSAPPAEIVPVGPIAEPAVLEEPVTGDPLPIIDVSIIEDAVSCVQEPVPELRTEPPAFAAVSAEPPVKEAEPSVSAAVSAEPPVKKAEPSVSAAVSAEPPVRKAVSAAQKEGAGDMAEIAGVISEMAAQEEVREYVFPPVDLLKAGSGKKTGNTESQLMETANKLQQTLKTFGVNVTVTNISCGPAVTRYEISPEMGVKVSKIVGLSDDIKLNLAAADIRIEAPIPGKAAVGIEVPNKENVTVAFRELIESQEFRDSESNISFAVGKDISGKTKVTDIAKMPHLLIAGATGSGKSVCINTIIMSILYKANPNDVKLIMIDPKVVELSVYNGIPHLLIPVVTDPKKASGALNWAVAEMTERYERFAEANVREINGYNAKVDSLTVPEGQERPKKMPQIVIIVDELADLMMVASNDVEAAICRLAQLARAAGIHLIIATQRPSVNVITGLIKANMPSRIAFAVTSGTDSRTILDTNGAEKLLGKGDMLFHPQGIPKPIRVQGAFVSDGEVSSVVEFITEQNGAASYSDSIQKKMESIQTNSAAVSISDTEAEDDGRDACFGEAARVIVDKEKASIGMLQRYLKVGFNRAARIMDQLEEAGIVGPEEGTKPRKVLMKPEDLDAYMEENA